MAQWAAKGFHFQQYWAVLSEGLIGLYEGSPAVAHRLLEQRWPQLEQAMMLRIQNVRVEALSLRGRLALASGDLTSARAALRSLKREPVGWARAQALILEAACDRGRAVELLTQAVARCESEGLALYAAAAQLRLGQLQPGAEGLATVKAAQSRFEAQGIRDLEAFARTLAPLPPA